MSALPTPYGVGKADELSITFCCCFCDKTQNTPLPCGRGVFTMASANSLNNEGDCHGDTADDEQRRHVGDFGSIIAHKLFG